VQSTYIGAICFSEGAACQVLIARSPGAVPPLAHCTPERKDLGKRRRKAGTAVRIRRLGV